MFFVVSVNRFNGRPDRPATADVNGKLPVILTSFNGELPQRARVIAGTVAENSGLEVGSIYLVQVTDNGENEYGTIYRHQVIGALSAVEFATTVAKMPQGQVVKVNATTTTAVAEPAGEKFK